MTFKTSQPQTPEQRRIVRTSVPVQSATRIATPATPASTKSQPPLDPKRMHNDIVDEFRAKHGSVPELEHVMREVWKRMGMSARPKS
jgi:hypothetical protein